MADHTIHITLAGNTFVAEAKFSDRVKLQNAGFDWNPQFKAWVTQNPQVASRFRPHADSEAKTRIDRSLISVEPWTGCDLYWPGNLDPRPFQCQAARWALERNSSYIAADPGLGKTIIAALVINSLNLPLRGMSKIPVVIVNQPGLCLNTEVELRKWCLGSPRIAIYRPESGEEAYFTGASPDILIVPDSLIADPLGEYEWLRRTIQDMTSFGDALLIVDEAQRFNNRESKRTKALFGLAERFERTVFLSGTPMRNRPHDLYSILSRFAGETIGFRNEHQFGFRYCKGFIDSFGVPNYKGASNVEELFTAVKSKFMMRIEKKDVLRELPPKVEEIVFLADGETPTAVTNYEREFLREYSPSDTVRDEITASPYVSTYRRMLGEAKVRPAYEFIRDLLELGDESILIFAEHIRTVEALEKLLKKYKPLVVTGKTPAREKQAKVGLFQADASRVFLGNTQACGTGFTLTRATRVVHVEPSWVPADSDQASDRAHRIGQKHSVFVQYLVFKNSLDRTIVETAMKKREILKQI